MLVKKLQTLLSSEANICRAPGTSQKIYLSASSDPKRYHTVDATAKSGKISCDCLNNKATHLCSHAVAVAIKGDCVNEYVEWFNSLDSTVNFDVVLNHGIGARNATKSARRTQVQLYGSKNPGPVQCIIPKATTLVSASQNPSVHGPAAATKTGSSRYVLRQISFMVNHCAP